jgi:hypothetical protein
MIQPLVRQDAMIAGMTGLRLRDQGIGFALGIGSMIVDDLLDLGAQRVGMGQFTACCVTGRTDGSEIAA